MKMAYERPVMKIEVFTPNSYIAGCGDFLTNTGLTIDSDDNWNVTNFGESTGLSAFNIYNSIWGFITNLTFKGGSKAVKNSDDPSGDYGYYWTTNVTDDTSDPIRNGNYYLYYSSADSAAGKKYKLYYESNDKADTLENYYGDARMTSDLNIWASGDSVVYNDDRQDDFLVAAVDVTSTVGTVTIGS